MYLLGFASGLYIGFVAAMVAVIGMTYLLDPRGLRQ